MLIHISTNTWAFQLMQKRYYKLIVGHNLFAKVWEYRNLLFFVILFAFKFEIDKSLKSDTTYGFREKSTMYIPMAHFITSLILFYIQFIEFKMCSAILVLRFGSSKNELSNSTF